MAHNGGLSQLNPWFLNLGRDFIFLNHFKTFSEWNFLTVGRDPTQTDANGYCTDAADGVYALGHIPSQTDRPGNYVLLWDEGGPDTTVGLQFSHTIVSGTAGGANGRLVFTPNTTDLDIRIPVIGTPYPRNLRLVHVDDEAALALDPYGFNPLFKEKMARIGIIRFLDLRGGNLSNIVRFQDSLPVDNYSYATSKYPAALYAGTTTNSGDDYTIAFPGFVRADKAQVLLKFNANASGTSPTIDIEGTGRATIKNPYGGTLFDSQKPTVNSSRVATLTWDESLGCYMKVGGDIDKKSYGIFSGVPIEIITKLCNEVGAHPWVLSPYLTVDPMSDYTELESTYLRDNLASGLKEIREPPNECWNNGFWATQYAYLKEDIRIGGSGNFDNHNWYGRVASKIGRLMSTIYSADRTRYEVINAVSANGWTFPATWANRMNSARWVTENGDDASYAAKNWTTAGSCAMYWGPDHDDASFLSMGNEYVTATDARKEEILYDFWYATGGDGTGGASLETITDAMQTWYTWFQSLGVTHKFLPYEGGLDMWVIWNTANEQTLADAAFQSVYLKIRTQQLYQAIVALGGEFPSKYGISGPRVQSMSWAVFQGGSYKTPTKEWDGIIDYSLGKRTFRLTTS